jgi:phosphatidylserine decarboxylase
MNHSSIIAREGWPYIGILVLLAILLALLSYNYYWLIPLGLALFVAYFFRNPERSIPTDEGLILSPADGKIMEINTVWEDRYLKSSAIQVRIFLSLFNVHVNRVPFPGRVEWLSRSGSTYLPAYKKEAGTSNVSNYVGIHSAKGKIMVVQITGLVARRLVCWLKLGDQVQSGERLGLIKFGSCTELYLPVSTEILVQPGEKVRGGETIIGRFSN